MQTGSAPQRSRVIRWALRRARATPRAPGTLRASLNTPEDLGEVDLVDVDLRHALSRESVIMWFSVTVEVLGSGRAERTGTVVSDV